MRTEKINQSEWNELFEFLKNSCGSAEGSLGNGCAHPSANLAGAISPAATGTEPPAGMNCAQEHRGDTALDALAGRVQAANRVIAKMGICPEDQDCLRANPQIECRLYTCDQCGKRMCALCMENHEMEPHVTDAMTAREMESSR